MNIKFFENATSTNELAKEFNEPWTVIVAGGQTKGHGTKGTSWFSPKGGLYFSVVLPRDNLKDLETITILGAFIVSKIIKQEFNLEPFIKLPNDVYVNNKKICGILTENIIQKTIKSSVMGIGLNTNVSEFEEGLNATSIKIEIKKEVDNIKILKLILTELKKQYGV